MVMGSARVVLMVMTSWPLTVNSLPGLAGSLGLMVATSKAGLASAAIGVGGGGGSGMDHAVSGVAFVSTSGIAGPPWDQVPSMVFPSPLTLPSKVPFKALIVIFTVEPFRVNVVAGIAGDRWS